MIKIAADYYDGLSSEKTSVTVCFHRTGDVLIEGNELKVNTSLDQLSIKPRLANTRRNIFFNNGAKLETADNDAIDRVCHYFDKNIISVWIHQLEKSFSYAFLALILTVVFIWGGIEYAIPVAAKWVVKSIPNSVDQHIGQQGLKTLDEWLFMPSKIDADKQQHLQNYFNQLVITSKGQNNYQLLLRHSKVMGANALALPGGIIIMTDGLVRLAKNDEQIMAVLAHEMGHIDHQHGLRSLLQNSVTALFMAGILGDITSITALSVALPTVLVENQYSRKFEQQADQYAIDFLLEHDIEVKQFSRILSLLEKPNKSKYKFDYLSSHPAMDKRIKMINGL